jgi:NAD(P)-dependent dehydrogenase (short-subunit alcohol dehydrogenase family)
VLLNNAGVIINGPSFEGLDNWKAVMDVNLFGCETCSSSVFFLALVFVDGWSYRSILNVQHTFVPVWRDVSLCGSVLWTMLRRKCDQQMMLHQENQSVIINTGSKQGITNPP